MENNKKITRDYFGSGKDIGKYGDIKVTIDVEQFLRLINDYQYSVANGKKYASFIVAKRQSPDAYGRTHSCYFMPTNNWGGQGVKFANDAHKAENVDIDPNDLPF